MWAGALLCLAAGLALVRLGWAGRSTRAADLLLQLSLAVGFGLGIFSLIFFLALVFHYGTPRDLLWIDGSVCVLLLAAGFLIRRRQPASVNARPDAGAEWPAWLRRLLPAAVLAATAGALYAAIMHMRAHPHGDGWDAFAIWNLHARFLARGGEHWRDGFTNVPSWSHPDYPLLLPAAIAHFWAMLGSESTLVPSLVGFAFTFATAGVLVSALALVRGREAAMLGAIALLTTPAFVEQGVSQYADVPLSFFILTTVVLLNLQDAREDAPGNGSRFALAGMAAAFAAWTKNEGLLFFGMLLLAPFLVLIARRGSAGQGASWAGPGRQSATMLMAAAPVLLVLADFKHAVAHPDEVFSGSAASLHQLLDLSRYWAILQWYAKEWFRFGHWWLVPATVTLTGLYLVAGRDRTRASNAGFQASLVALSLTLAGYAGIYLVASYEIHWHLRFSLNRLFLQFWPSAIFLFFAVMRYGEE